MTYPLAGLSSIQQSLNHIELSVDIGGSKRYRLSTLLLLFSPFSIAMLHFFSFVSFSAILRLPTQPLFPPVNNARVTFAPYLNFCK